MKKYLAIFLLMTAGAFSQNIALLNGVTNNLIVGKTSTADTVYTIGTFDMTNVDSIQVQISTTDSAHIALLAQVVTPQKTTDTATVLSTGVVGGAAQLTAAGIANWMWYNFQVALKPYYIGATAITLKVRVYLTGTETYNTALSTADKFRVQVKQFKSR